ncbi:PREDICTED: mitochondrial import receptor subunit TOM22 homolog [Nicrophorus vespilloides]|uniref:Mitochondrial import receptor subunit TOM22 homolog n=1 Tax=Nicrophorus vespilloides TaxID=110193 RepID=A0ABM1MN42_NICVS|nr:PREDICTED: mitochondrial import receptor subunit TOM22 homolog [Nicrophorus vespilloides]
MATVDDIDSGMESQPTSAKDTTPEKKSIEIENDLEDEPDETLSERLLGLGEMFPDSVRKVSCAVAENTTAGVKNLYNFSRNALWIVFSTSIILFAPVIFEVERAQLEELQRNQQKQLLLGPNTAMAGGPGMSLMPPVHR